MSALVRPFRLISRLNSLSETVLAYVTINPAVHSVHAVTGETTVRVGVHGNVVRNIHVGQALSKSKKTVGMTFVYKGESFNVKAPLGENLLDVIIDSNLDVDGFGACEGTLACSTCHLIFKDEDYKSLPNKPTDEELDMLDLAYGLSDTSRLGCQVIVTEDLDGLVVKVPEGVADAREV